VRSEGTLDVAAPRERVFELFADPRRVSECAPDVQELTVLDPQHFRMKVRAGVGAVKGVFGCEVRYTEVVPAERIVASVRGEGAGSRVDLVSTLELSSDGADRTTVRWVAEVTLSGLLAAVGSRFVNAAAERMTREVFDCVKARLEPR